MSNTELESQRDRARNEASYDEDGSKNTSKVVEVSHSEVSPQRDEPPVLAGDSGRGKEEATRQTAPLLTATSPTSTETVSVVESITHLARLQKYGI